MNKWLVFLWLLAGIGIAGAETRTFTLDQAVDYALKHNSQIKQLEQDEKIAGVKLNQALWDIYLPDVSISAGLTVMDPGTVDRSTITGLSYTVSTQNLPVFNSGGTPTGDYVPSVLLLPSGYYTNQSVWQDNYALNLNINKPLFTGTALYNNYRIQKQQFELAKMKRTDKIGSVEYDIRTGFFNLLMLRENIKLMEELDKQLESTLEFTRANYRAGYVSEYDLIQVRVQYLNNQPALLKLRNAYRIAKLAYLNLLGFKETEDVEFLGDLMSVTNMLPPELTLEKAQGLALSNDINLQSMNTSLEVMKLTRIINERSRWPMVSGFFSYKYDYHANKDKEADTDPDRVWGGSWNTGLQVSIPIDDWLPVSKTAHGLKELDANIEKTRIAIQQTRDGVVLQVRQLMWQIDESKETMQGQNANVAQARLGLRLANDKYRAGTISSLDLNQAEVSYSQSRANLLQAVYDYLTAILKLRKMTGMME